MRLRMSVSQSTQTQVQTNLESQRRQYELVETARQHGFRTVDVIDNDLGRSVSGSVARPGFERLVAGLCSGMVGGVFCLKASRLARNGRDWHHVLELCGLVEARVIDLDGVYDPCRPNDRLLLGMKGSISEFELGVLRSRMLEAARSKARRGELRYTPPVGFDFQFHQPFSSKADHLAQQIGVGGLLHKRPQVHHLVGHQWSLRLQVGVCNQTLPESADGHRIAARSPQRYRWRARERLHYRRATPLVGT